MCEIVVRIEDTAFLLVVGTRSIIATVVKILIILLGSLSNIMEALDLGRLSVDVGVEVLIEVGHVQSTEHGSVVITRRNAINSLTSTLELHLATLHNGDVVASQPLSINSNGLLSSVLLFISPGVDVLLGVLRLDSVGDGTHDTSLVDVLEDRHHTERDVEVEHTLETHETAEISGRKVGIGGMSLLQGLHGSPTRLLRASKDRSVGVVHVDLIGVTLEVVLGRRAHVRIAMSRVVEKANGDMESTISINDR
jgi:hypothetical protein